MINKLSLNFILAIAIGFFVSVFIWFKKVRSPLTQKCDRPFFPPHPSGFICGSKKSDRP
ncbi:hypothetical protein QUA54_30175 [Microcoleus sp. MOSTC5]|uniref:hypothetical protein n=1 Tax=Microcoleus sp. MOSTC5 TaxID=3055378 RepID=UPI002FCFD202